MEPTAPQAPPDLQTIEQPVVFGQPQPSPTPAQPPAPTSQPPKRSRKKGMLIGLLVVVLLVAASVVWLLLKPNKQPVNKTTLPTSSTTKQQAAPPKATEQVFVSPVDGGKTAIDSSAYYDVVVGTNHFYGHVSMINKDYLRLTPTAYMQTNTLRLSGNELHAPEPATYFSVAQIKGFQKLSNAVIINALKSGTAAINDAFPSTKINEYIKAGQLQAFTFADGKVFFATTDNLSGSFLLTDRNVYYLKQEGSGTQTNTSLVVATSAQLKNYTVTNLLYWQNMKPSSQVTKAVIQYEKQNP